MKHVTKFFCVMLLAGCFVSAPSRAQANASVELYGTFNAMGITVSLADTDDPDMDARAAVEYRSGNQPYQPGFPLSRISPTRFVGSLFWLASGTDYDVRVTFTDPDGDPIDSISLVATAATQQELTIPTPNNTHFVDPSGNGTDCSLALPCSLSQGISQAQPGDEIVLRDGVYYQGDIYLPRSGTPDAPIVIRSHDNERAILDGADPNHSAWSAIGGGVFKSSASVADTKLVIADTVRLYPYATLADLQNLSWGVPGFYTDGFDLYVHLESGTDPNNVAMSVSRYTYGFNVQHDHIYFESLTFRHYGAISSSRAISLKDASNNLVQGCTFAFNLMGIYLKDESHRNVIQNNMFYDSKYDWPWDAVKAASRLEQGGLDFSSSAPGRGTVIRRNTFHDYFDAFTVCPQAPNDRTNETDVYENLVYRAGDDGVQTDGWCSNVRLWSNTFYDVLTGISFAPVVGGPVYAIRNLIYRFGAGNNTHSGRSFKFNSHRGDELGPIYLFHNTVDAMLPDAYGLSISGVVPGTTSLIHARNNIWSGSTYALRNKNLDFPVDLDHNNLYNKSSEDLVLWESTVYTDLLIFNAVSGQELNGLNVDPNFGGTQQGEYDLNAASDLIDAGLIIPGINDDYLGPAPDIGAFEYNDVAPTCVDEKPTITLEKLTSTSNIKEPQGIAYFTTSIANNAVGPCPVTITALTDDKVGDVTLADNATCLLPHTIHPNDSYTCSFQSDVAGNAGETYVYTTVASGAGINDTIVSASDEITITFTNTEPVIVVTNDADPSSVPEANDGGGEVTFSVTLLNDSVETDPITIMSARDEVRTDFNGDGDYGDAGEVANIDITDSNLINTTCDTLMGTVLQSSERVTCEFTIFTAGQPFEDPVHTVVVTAEDDENSNVSDADVATVDIIAETPIPDVLHIGGLHGTSNPNVRGNKWNATVTIVIHDGNETPLSEATVSGLWSGSASGSDLCITDSSGACSINKSNINFKAKRSDGFVSFTVTNVTHHAAAYQPGDNHNVDSTVDGAAIGLKSSDTQPRVTIFQPAQIFLPSIQ